MARFAPSTGLLSAAALAATAWAAPAPGQGLDIRTLFTAPTAGVQDWSGESRRLQSPADDGAGDPRRGSQLPQLPRGTLAAGGTPRRFARGVRGQCRGPHARSADHGSAR